METPPPPGLELRPALEWRTEIGSHTSTSSWETGCPRGHLGGAAPGPSLPGPLGGSRGRPGGRGRASAPQRSRGERPPPGSRRRSSGRRGWTRGGRGMPLRTAPEAPPCPLPPPARAPHPVPLQTEGGARTPACALHTQAAGPSLVPPRPPSRRRALAAPVPDLSPAAPVPRFRFCAQDGEVQHPHPQPHAFPNSGLPLQAPPVPRTSPHRVPTPSNRTPGVPAP